MISSFSALCTYQFCYYSVLCSFTTVSLTFEKVPEYSPSFDDDGICKTAFEIIFAFDEAISLGNKENVTVQQVKQYCEMESHEEKAHKLMMQAKINETKDLMKKRANELDKMRV
jgi:coatomer subunit delta